MTVSVTVFWLFTKFDVIYMYCIKVFLGYFIYSIYPKNVCVWAFPKGENLCYLSVLFLVVLALSVDSVTSQIIS